MKTISHVVYVYFKPGSTFAERENHLNSEITKIEEHFSSQNIKVVGHNVVNRNDSKATVNVFLIL